VVAGPTGRESDKFMLRLSEGMRDQIKAEAERNNRSMNAEILHRLEMSFVSDLPQQHAQASELVRVEEAVLRRLEEVIERIAAKHGVTQPLEEEG
jgi:hypothetical protein